MIKYYNIEAIKKLKEDSKIAPKGFRYGFASGIFKEDVYLELIKTFPLVSKFELVDKQSGGGRKRFFVGPNYYSGKDWGSIGHLSGLSEIWKEVIEESGSEELTTLLRDALGVELNSLCNFGFTYGDGGCVQEPHIDGAARPNDPSPVHSTVACLMYFNEKPGGVAGTEVYDTDRKTVIFRVPDLRNSFFYFEQHIDSWHGFPVVPEGSDRRLVSLSFSQENPRIAITNSLFSHFVNHIFTLSNIKKTIKKFVGN